MERSLKRSREGIGNGPSIGVELRPYTQVEISVPVKGTPTRGTFIGMKPNSKETALVLVDGQEREINRGYLRGREEM